MAFGHNFQPVSVVRKVFYVLSYTMKEDIPAGVLAMLGIPSLGPKTVKLFYSVGKEFKQLVLRLRSGLMVSAVEPLGKFYFPTL